MVTIFAYLVARCCYIIHLCPDFVLTPSTEIELRFLSDLLACLMRTYAALFALLLLIHMKNCFPTMLIFFPDLVLDICYNETCYNNYW
jgi:hypothetical protein